MRATLNDGGRSDGERGHTRGLPGKHELIEIGRKAIDLALDYGAKEADAFVLSSEGTSFSIEGDMITYSSWGMDFGIGLRILKDGKLGFSFTTEAGGLKTAAKQACAISSLSKEQYFSFPEKAPTPLVEGLYDPRIVGLSLEDGIDSVELLLTGCQTLSDKMHVTRGSLGFGQDVSAIVNTKGLEIAEEATSIGSYLSAVIKEDGISTGFASRSSRLFDIDFESLGKESGQMTLEGVGAAKVEGGIKDIIFTPDAVADLFEFCTAPALIGERALKGESVYSEKVGSQVAHKSFSLRDDGSLSSGLNSASTDDEGVVSKPFDLIKEGELLGYLFDIKTALRFDTQTTGNGIRAERWGGAKSPKVPPSTCARNLMVIGDGDPLDDLIKEVSDGLIVHEILGSHTANPISGDFSVGASIFTSIKDGERTHPGKDAMISGNFPNLLNKIKGFGTDIKQTGGGLSPVVVVTPSICFESVQVTV